MEVIQRVWIWILLCASVLILTDAMDELPACNRDANNSRVEWRMTKQTTQIYLNSTNIACYSGEKCSNLTKKNEDVSTTVAVVIQRGDEIQVFIDIDETGSNSSSRINILSKQESSHKCDKEHQKILMTSETNNFTLEGALLKAGDFNIFVHLIQNAAECESLWSLQIKVQENECMKNKDQNLCSGKGFCDNFSNTGSFSCRCCVGYVGKYCEERDGCYGNPCQHGGFCVDIAEGLLGTTFQCLCPHGYRGRSCEGEVSLCDRKPCLNNGTCSGNQTEFSCECPKGFAGSTCETNVNECLSNPCVHGVCEDGFGGYKCYCLPGYEGDHYYFNYDECRINRGACEDLLTGYRCHRGPVSSFRGDHCGFEYDEYDINRGAYEDLVAGYRCHRGPVSSHQSYGGDHCEFEYDECDSSPCINGGACEDLVAGYRCHCGPGYEGRRCQIKVDLCKPNPCLSPAQCVDRGNNYSCICHPGYNGPGCTQHYDPCYPNPCQNGGSCWPSLDSYFCSCNPGFTGDLCEEAMVAAQPLPRTLEDPGEPEEHQHHHHTSNADGEVIDRWHNLYLVGTMLCVAASLVALVAVACHCRLNKTYQRFTRKISRSCSDLKQQKLEDPGKFSLNLRGSASEGPPKDPPYEASSVDMGDSLDAPLIC